MTTPLGATLGFPHVIRSQFKIFCCQMSQLFTHTHRQTHALTPLLFHSPTLTSPNAVRSTRNENKRLEFRVWHQIEFSSHRPPTPSVSASCFLFLFFLITPSQICSLLQTKNRKKKKTWKKNSHFLPLKNKLNGKKNSSFFFFYVFIYIFVFQIQGTMSICIPIRLHSQVQCANMVSHEPDCLLIQLYISPVCTLNTVIKRCVCFG